MRNLFWIVGAVILSLWMVGCAEKDDTRAAKVEEAKIAIDNGNYQEAIDILAPMLDKDADGEFTVDEIQELLATEEEFELAQLLATAYLGAAGIDTFEIIKGAEEAQKVASVPRTMQRVLGALQKNNPFVVTPVYAQSTGKDCMTDATYLALTSALPVPLTQSNLTDVTFGLQILDHLISNAFLQINVEPRQNAAFLDAVGYAVKVAIEIILATDINNVNNIPDFFTGIPDSTADKVELGFTKALAALDQVEALGDVDFGATPFDNDIIENTVNDLRGKIRGGEPKATGTTLGNYLRDVTDKCDDR